MLDVLPDAVMLRAEWMYDVRSPKPNYILNILRATDSVAFSSGQYRGVTYLREVAENMEKVISLPGGAYNFGSETTQSMYEITKQLAKLLGKNLVVGGCAAETQSVDELREGKESRGMLQ